MLSVFCEVHLLACSLLLPEDYLEDLSNAGTPYKGDLDKSFNDLLILCLRLILSAYFEISAYVLQKLK